MCMVCLVSVDEEDKNCDTTALAAKTALPPAVGLWCSCLPHSGDVAHSQSVTFTVFLACSPSYTGLILSHFHTKALNVNDFFFLLCITAPHCLSCVYEGHSFRAVTHSTHSPLWYLFYHCSTPTPTIWLPCVSSSFSHTTFACVKVSLTWQWNLVCT